MPMQPDLNDLYYFVQVVDHGGFAPAGRALDIPKSRLSRRIALLEERLGVRLLQRSTRRFAVTELGKAYYARCKAMLIEAEAAQTFIESTHTEPCGLVRLACPIALLHQQVGPMLVAFATKHPRVQIQLMGLNRTVDVVAEGFDVALRMKPLPLEDSDLAMRVLSHASQCLVAAPNLIEIHGAPRSPIDLTEWPSLGYGMPTTTYTWVLRGPDDARAEQHHVPRFVTTDVLTLQTAALAGLGAVQLPEMMVRDQIADGCLVRLLPEWLLPDEVIHAVFPTRRGLVPAVRGLIDHLAAGFANLAHP